MPSDPLSHFRDRFEITDPSLIYLDGNSLGRMPKAAPTLLNEITRMWGDRLIRGWNEGWWLDLQTRIGDKIAHLVDASPGEVIIADSTSVNLFKLAAAALQMRPGRTKIVTDDLNFPSDLYILQGVCRLLGPAYRLEVVPSEDGIHGPLERLSRAIDTDTALVTLSHTVFKSGYTYPMESVTAQAHKAGALTLWDLSHSAGALPVPLNRSGADFAVGCTYKYLNGGPGAPAFLYVRKDLQGRVQNPVSGWIGQAAPFEFGLDYQPAAGLRRMLTGTPPIFSIAAIEPGVDLVLEAGLDALRAKSLAQTDYLLTLWEQHLQPRGFGVFAPRSREDRGSHIGLSHANAWGIDQALIDEMNVIPDFRAPDVIRLGVTPLYTSFEEIALAVQRMAEIVDRGLYKKYEKSAVRVT